MEIHDYHVAEAARRDGILEGRAEGRAEGLKDAVMALKGIVDPAVIVERFKMSLEQVMDILGH